MPHKWIFDALDATEHLDGDNRYHCGVCCELVTAERSTQYVTSPAILTLHLKRFTADAKLVFSRIVSQLLHCFHFVDFLCCIIYCLIVTIAINSYRQLHNSC